MTSHLLRCRLKLDNAIYIVSIPLVLSLLLPFSCNEYINGTFAQTNLSQSPIASPIGSSDDMPRVQITSHHNGQQVQPGQLTIEGISSDNKDKNCQVYADVNDNTPMQNVTSQSESRDPNDFSRWSFTYTPMYQLIVEGENELTAKISCFQTNNSTSTLLSEWHTVNITGTTAIPEIIIIPVTPSPSTLGFSGSETDNTEINEEEDGEFGDSDEEDAGEEGNDDD